MWTLLAIGFLVPFVYIGYLLSKLDKFLKKNGDAIEGGEVSPIAIVLGRTGLAMEVGELLKKNGIGVLYLAEPFLLERGRRFHYLFALSENDADNIILCKIGEKIYSIEKTISLCNDRRNETMFIGEGIRCLSGRTATAQILYQTAMQEPEVKL